jgi:hypothetical protein
MMPPEEREKLENFCQLIQEEKIPRNSPACSKNETLC